MFDKMFGGRKAHRTFKVTNVVNTDGCPTKFKHGRYTGNHQSAARKAFNVLCNHKKVKGKCMFYVTIQETTRGSGRKVMVNNANNKGKKASLVKKERHYKVERVKLPKAVLRFEGTDKEYKILYKNKASFVKRLPPCKVNRLRTRGVMKKISRRTNKRRANEKKKRKSQRKQMNNNLQMNNAYGNNQLKGGAKRSKSKARKNKNKRSLRKGRK
jgi:hypothetical protein